MLDNKQIERLSHVNDFVDFLEELSFQKESIIQSLHGLPTEQLQQATGRLLQVDDVLKMGGWYEIQQRKMLDR